MAQQNKKVRTSFRTRRAGGIHEERQFTNPAIRFVRIKGRVVPIFNKKRVGQLTERAGSKLMLAGGTLAGAGAAMKIGKSLFKKSKIPKVAKFVDNTTFGKFVAQRNTTTRAKRAAVNALKKKSIGRQAAGVLARAAAKPIKFTAKHPLGVGLSMLGAGLAARVGGAELQAMSHLGFDVLPEKE